MPTPRGSWTAAPAFAAGLSFLAACSGQIGTAGLEPNGEATVGGQQPSAPRSTDRNRPATPEAMPPPATPAVAPLVRIGPIQWANIVHDRFGVAGPPATDFPSISTNDTKLDLRPLLEAYLAAAELVASRAFAEGGPFFATCAASVDRGCAEKFVRAQGRLLFRRPLSVDETAALVALYEASAALGPRDALAHTLVAMLVSTPFLYRVERPRGTAAGPVALSPEEIATRMAFLAWNSGPTAELLDLAAAGGLDTGAKRAAQLEAMLTSDKGRRMTRDLVSGWLHTRKVTEIRKDPTLAKAFTPEVAKAMAEETERFAEETFAAPGSSFVDLLTAEHSFVDDTLKALYGIAGTRGSGPVERVALPAGQRSGVLTHGAVLSVHTNPAEASPVERGVFLYETVLCQARPAVPQEVPALPASESNGRHLSQRERLEHHRRDPSCKSCHEVFDGYGLALENYDLIGRYIETEGTTPLTGEATVTGLDGKTHRFRGAAELGRVLAASPTARACFVEKTYRHFTGFSVDQIDPAALSRISAAFQLSADMRQLLIDIAADPAFAVRSF